MTSADDEEQRFQGAIPLSYRAVLRVAEFFKEEGYNVVVKASPEFVDRAVFHNRGGDLHLEKNGLTLKVEVKHRLGYNFTPQRLFPFAFILLNNKAAIDREVMDLYVSVSGDMKALLILTTAESREHWRVCEISDRKYSDQGYVMVCYECPREFAKYHWLERPPTEAEIFEAMVIRERARFAREAPEALKSAEAIREAYQRPSADALKFAEKAKAAAEALMDDAARARVAAGYPAFGPLDNMLEE